MVVMIMMHGFFVLVMYGFLMLVMYGFLVMIRFLRMPEPLGMTMLVALPVWMVLGPLRMVLVHPAGIVVMPPVRLVPTVIGTIGAPSTAVGHLSPDVGMFVHE